MRIKPDAMSDNSNDTNDSAQTPQQQPTPATPDEQQAAANSPEPSQAIAAATPVENTNNVQQTNHVPVCNGISHPEPQRTVDTTQAVGTAGEEEVALVINKTTAFPQAFPPATAPSNNSTAIRVTANEMEVMELKVKVICQEKNILALKMELKSAELQVDAKNKIDEKKTRLVELLDNKLAAVEKRNAKLLEMLEQMLKDKDANTSRLKDATKNMTDLSKRLGDSERIKTELLRVNSELRKMLDSIETKGSQIAKLAKEKVLKYRDENDAMHLELNNLKDEAAVAAAETESAAVAASAAGASRIAAAAADSSACNELWGKIKEIQEQISTALKEIDAAQVGEFRQTVQEASDANEALKASVEEARVKTGEDLSALSVENDQLRSLIEDFDVARKKMEKTEATNRVLLAEHIDSMTAKDKEITEMKEELQRLKGAIGLLIGSK